MSSIDIPIPVSGITARSRPEEEGNTPLRIVLLRGETLRVPRATAAARILSGTAWLTAEGKDIVLAAGERMDLRGMRGGVVVSAVGNDALMVQLDSGR